jgi:hypothetical protein
MRRAHALLVPLIALGLSGCFLKKTPVVKPAATPINPAAVPAPAPPPEPLSVNQTSVQLPPPQPVTPEAALTTQLPEETPAPAAPVRPARPAVNRPGTATQTRPPEPAPPPVATPPATAEPDRAPLQEQLPDTEIKRLQEEATARKNEARQLVVQARKRHLTRQQSGMVDRIDSFIKQAEEAAIRGDMRQASELAERALVLAKELRP